MFTKLKTVKKFNKEIITIQQLQSIVKNNPQKEYITYVRGLEYKSKEYNNSKLNINCITPHGVFVDGMRNDNLKSFSGYLFYDIDGIDTIEELNDTIKRLCNEYPISFLQRSLSYKGFHFLIKVDDTFSITDDTFEDLYKYVFNQLVNSGYNIDKSATGISRKMIISSDEGCLLNDKVSLLIDKVSLSSFIEDNKSKQVNGNGRIKSRSIEGNETYKEYKLIPIETLLTQINVQTTNEVVNGYKIQEIDYYRIYYNNITKDGFKHTEYIRIMNALFYLNDTITIEQIYSLLSYINKRAENPMNDYYLRRYVCNISTSIIKTESYLKLKMKKKKIHLDTRLKTEDKIMMGAKINGKIRQNESIQKIEDARLECSLNNIVPTQKVIQKMSGLSMSTIKRNWNKQLTDLNNIELPEIVDDVQIERDNKLKDLLEENTDLFTEVLSEDSFFNTQEDIEEEIVQPQEDIRVIEHKYKGFKSITLVISKQDKEDFKNAVQRVKDNGFVVCLSTLSLCGVIDKYKLDYLYNIWVRKQKHICREI